MMKPNKQCSNQKNRINESGQSENGQVIRWVEHRTSEPQCVCRRRPSHRDPTADAAIGRVMREEKRKKRLGSAPKKAHTVPSSREGVR